MMDNHTTTKHSYGSILIVDDLLENLQLLSEILSNHGYKIHTATSGQEAIESANTIPTDLILLDIMLPDLDGFEVCKSLKANEKTKAIPIIFISALSETKKKLLAFSLGAADYITKPFILNEVLARVKTQIEICNLRLQTEHQAKQMHFRNEQLLIEIKEHEISHRQLQESLQKLKLSNAEVLKLVDNLNAEIALRSKNEESLRQSNEMIVKLTNQVPGVVYQYRLFPDGSSCFPFASQGMETIYEVTPEQVREDATPVFGMLHSEDKEHIISDIMESAKNQTPFHSEFRMVLPRQGLRWRLSDAKPELLSDGSTLWYGIISDITERKLVEEALKENERRLREAQKMAHLGFWNWNVKSGSVEWSDEVFNIFGLDPETFEPQIDSIMALSPWPGEHERNQELIKRTMESKAPGSFEQKFLRSDKSIGYYYSTFEGRYNEKGELLAIVGTVLDITSHKLAEQQLQSQYTLLTALINSPKDLIIFSFDKHGCYTTFNEKHFAEMKQIFGVEIVPGMNLLDSIPVPELKEIAKKSMVRALQGETISEIHHQPDLNTYYEYSWNPIWENENVIGVTVFVKNITIKMQQDAEQKRLLHILESSLNEIYVFDSKNLVFEYANQASLQNLGYSLESMKKMTPLQLKPHFTEVQFRQLIEPLLTHQKEQIIFETEHLRANGSLYPVEVHLQLVENEGQQLFFAVIMDITERKKADQKIMSQLDELQRWQKVTLGREDRNRQLKQEVNELLLRLEEDIRYPSQES
ncbi:MAG: PAS domain S-box protein [Salinivirgaceae bacterium]